MAERQCFMRIITFSFVQFRIKNLDTADLLFNCPQTKTSLMIHCDDPLATRQICLPKSQFFAQCRKPYAKQHLHILVCSVYSVEDFQTQEPKHWNKAVFVDVRNMIEDHLLDAARINRRHDGRHPKFWKLLLKSASMKAIVSYVYELATASNFPTS